jgi:hypothetical protein
VGGSVPDLRACCFRWRWRRKEFSDVSCVARQIARSRRSSLMASPRVGEGCAGPWKANIRWLQATQARWSATLRAFAACSAECRTDTP